MTSTTYKQVTDRIIAELEKGAAPWVKPWTAGAAFIGNDRNVVSQKPYRGINRLLLGMQSATMGYQSNEWGTFKQWQEKGASVRKGERATHIVFFKPVNESRVNDEGETENSSYCVIRGYCVFNASQVDGYESAQPAAPIVSEFERHERAEATMLETGAVIRHGGDRAFYRPSTDSIQLPEKAAFTAPASYYATAFHELGHWTGASSRLDRELDKGAFGNPAYAFEELVAELTAAFLCAEHGIQGELRHAGYIQSWLKACRENDRAIFKAAALAQQAADYVLQRRATEEKAAA
jgi:antirestriction protein ArdC